MTTLTNIIGIVYMLMFLTPLKGKTLVSLCLLVCIGIFTAACTPTATTSSTPASGSSAATSASSDPSPTAEILVTANVTAVPLSDPVGDMVEEYLQARVSSDETKLRDLTCADQEKNISIHVNSFKGQDASLRDVQCTFDGTNKVTCGGEIVLVYDGEEQTRAPGSFTVVEEDGRWLWCGETR